MWPATFLLLALPLWLQGLDRVHLDRASGEITLAARNATLRETPSPARWDVITDLAVYRGRLLAAASMDFDESSVYAPLAYSHGAQVLEFRPERGEWTVLLDQEGSMFFHARVVGPRLLLPEYSPFDDRARRIHAYDGEAWSRLGPLPKEAWHVMDVIRWRDRLYAAGSWRDEGQEARGSDPDWWAGYGHVFESSDEGETWRDLRRTTEPGRILDLIEFRGRLVANERGKQLIAWDGTRWEEIPVRLPGIGTAAKLGNAHLASFAGRILAYHAELVYVFDGRAWSSQQPGFLDHWIEGERLYAIRADGHVWETSDGAKWTKVTREGVSPAAFDRQAPKGRPLNRGAVAIHRGRLYVGTAATGVLYAAPYEERGTFSGDPTEFAEDRRLRVAWEAAGAGLRIRWRSATSRVELTRAAWHDLAVPNAPVARPPGHRWVQFRAELSGDGSRTPVLRSVGWQAE